MERDQYLRAMVEQITLSLKVIDQRATLPPYMVDYHEAILKNWGIIYDSSTMEPSDDEFNGLGTA